MRGRTEGDGMSPLAAPYKVEYFPVVERAWYEQFNGSDQMRRCVESISLPTLLIRALEVIASFFPDAILLHTGIAFQSRQQLFFDLFREIRRQHPEIACGIQRRPTWTNDYSMFDETEGMAELEKLFFRDLFGYKW